jgi:Na+/H+-dicarboxylate symporter
MLVLLTWVIRFAPVGVFGLSFAFVASAGVSVVGTLGMYVVLLCAILCLTIAAVFGVVAVFGTVPFRLFASAVAPALAVAFASRSSMAALPVLIKSVRERLPFSETMAGVLLPLSASLLRLSVPTSQTVAALFAAHAFGVHLETTQIVLIVAMTVMLSFSVPGIPNGSFIVMVPLFETLGIPGHAAGLLLAVDMIPDTFKTMLNVTGHLAAASLIADTRDEKHVLVAAGATTPA